MAFLSVVFLTGGRIPDLIRKTSEKFSLRDILQNACPALFETVEAIKTGEARATATVQRSLRDTRTKCDVCWVGPGTEQGILNKI